MKLLPCSLPLVCVLLRLWTFSARRVTVQDSSSQVVETDAEADLDTSIVDGVKWPWYRGAALDFAVKIFVRTPGKSSGRTLCSGSLLQDGMSVLTAAHCVRFKPTPTYEQAIRGIWPDLEDVDISTMQVVFADGTKRGVYNILAHPKYRGASDYDIAVLQISNFPYRPYSPAVAVQIGKSASGVTDHGLYVAGFGATAGTGKVGEVKVAYLEVHDKCPTRDAGTACTVAPAVGKSISKRQSTCQGDSGAPFFIDVDSTKFIGPYQYSGSLYHVHAGTATETSRNVKRVTIVGVNAEGIGDCGDEGKATAFTTTSSPEVHKWLVGLNVTKEFVDVDFVSIPNLDARDAVRPWVTDV